MTGKKSSTRKRTSLSIHKDNDCGCSIETNPHNCQYQQFIDGWSFVPDVGRGGSSGEVFTPRFIVDKMITDSSMFPTNMIYHYDFDQDIDTLSRIVSSRICEPAVGTGNFISTILWYRLRAAYSLSKKDPSANLQELILQAVENLYCFDIDPGNAEITFRRLTDGNSRKIDDIGTVKLWLNNIVYDIIRDRHNDFIDHIFNTDSSLFNIVINAINYGTDNNYPLCNNYVSIIHNKEDKELFDHLKDDIFCSQTLIDPEIYINNTVTSTLFQTLINILYDKEINDNHLDDNDFIQDISQFVDVSTIEENSAQSLSISKDNWENTLHNQGVLTTFFTDYGIEDDELLEKCKTILRCNIKVFNGIEEESSSVMPGWRSVWWCRWNKGELIGIDSMNNEIISSQIQEKQDYADKILKEYYIDNTWVDKKKKSEFNKLHREKKKLEGKIIDSFLF